MEIPQFNSLSLKEKEQYLKTLVGEKKPFVSGVIVFEDYTIAVTYSLNGQLIHADLGIHGEKEKAGALQLLNGKEFFPIDGSQLLKVKEAINDKIFRAMNRHN